jgi:VIT1/CCC1 family predicted Fe2+/Mn2+ transporter
MRHGEFHRTAHVGWLRASVLGANDGLISTSSLAVGVAAANSARPAILIAAFAGLVAGALSMAAGEYVSVSSQADTEKADTERERRELVDQPEFELQELTEIYKGRGLDDDLAGKVATQLMEHDAIGTHLRDELGITETSIAQPLQAAVASAAAFAVGAALPVIVVALVPLEHISTVVVVSALMLLVLLGALAARLGGAPIVKGAVRVAFWGATAMGLTFLVGRIFGTTV